MAAFQLRFLKYFCLAALLSGSLYLVALFLLATIPSLQSHVFYLHRLPLVWFSDLAVPEQFGFGPKQVSSFFIQTAENRKLHAWHVLPIGTYRRNLDVLLGANDESSYLELLRSDPDGRLVVYLHGTAGCIASGYRPDSYRALYAAAPDHIHVIAFDYRGYGLSSGFPSESGLLEDAIAVVEWALQVAKLPPSRIVLYGQSLGTAVAMSLMQHFAAQPQPICFAGSVLTASFSDVATLTATYRIGGVIPILSPLRKIPALLGYFTSFLTNTWISKDRISEFIKLSHNTTDHPPYHVSLLHAADDTDIVSTHSDVLFWHAVNASTPTGITYDDLQLRKQSARKNLGPGGWRYEHKTDRGVVQQTMLQYGKHDTLMAYTVTSLAVLQAFEAATPGFMT